MCPQTCNVAVSLIKAFFKTVCLFFFSVESRSKVLLLTIASILWILATFNLRDKNKSSNVLVMIYWTTLFKATMLAFLLTDKQVPITSCYYHFHCMIDGKIE